MKKKLKISNVKKGVVKDTNLKSQRAPVSKLVEKSKHFSSSPPRNWVKTGITGFDELLKKGIPKSSSNLICGGPGSGKTIFCLQTLYNAAKNGEKCIYFTFEESKEKLENHLKDFNMDPKNVGKQLAIVRYEPLDITRQVEAMLEKSKGELLIDISPLIFPKGFEKPDRIVVDSLSAIASVFNKKEDSYRTYIEHLFNIFDECGATTFLISETGDISKTITPYGIDEFVADGVILLYNVKKDNARQSAIEILKMRGAEFAKRIVAMQIVSEKGIIVYPEQEVFEMF